LSYRGVGRKTVEAWTSCECAARHGSLCKHHERVLTARRAVHDAPSPAKIDDTHRSHHPNHP